MLTLFLFIAALCYVTSALLPVRMRVAIATGTLTGWILHGLALISAILAPQALRLGFASMLSATMWLVIVVYWLENRNFALDGLRIMVLPCTAVAALLPLMFPGTLVPLAGKSALFSWHIVISLLAYSALTIAAFHAVLMAFQESRLHPRFAVPGGRWLDKFLDRLPALLAMERLLFRLIWVGFILLTLTVLSGVFFTEQLFGYPLQWNHKNLFTLLSWVLFGLLLAGRQWRGWRGKFALRLTLIGFATLLLAYVGSRFVLEVIMQQGLA